MYLHMHMHMHYIFRDTDRCPALLLINLLRKAIYCCLLNSYFFFLFLSLLQHVLLCLALRLLISLPLTGIRAGAGIRAGRRYTCRYMCRYTCCTIHFNDMCILYIIVMFIHHCCGKINRKKNKWKWNKVKSNQIKTLKKINT